jgi:hemolysin activation/secretion protein
MHAKHLPKICQTCLVVTFANLCNLASCITPTKAADTTSFPNIDASTDVIPNNEGNTTKIKEIAIEHGDFSRLTNLSPNLSPTERETLNSEMPSITSVSLNRVSQAQSPTTTSEPKAFSISENEVKELGQKNQFQLAQNTNNPPQPPTNRDSQPPSTKPPDEVKPEELPSPEELLKPIPSTTPLEEIPGNVPKQKFLVTGFEFKGNHAFSSEELAAALQDFTGKTLSFAQILEARSVITKLYVDAGYITSGAFIPSDSEFKEGGKVTIQILEGRLEKIKIKGNRRINTEYIRSRVAVAAGKPLNQKRLVEGLQILRLNPLFDSVSAELSATSEPGKSLLEITVVEAPTFSAQVNLNNGRSPSVGSFRRGVQLREANLLGWGDSIALGYTNTEGSNGIDASYSIPVSPYDTKLTLSYGTTSSNVIEPPFDILGIESQSRYYELTLSHPIFKTPTSDFTLGLTASRRESESSLEFENIGPFPLSPGADEKGRTNITAIRFFQEWTQRNSRQVLAFRSQFSFGINALDATINPAAPDSRFFAWRGQGQWVRLIGRDAHSLILLRTDVQVGDRPLLSSEQFGIGGLDNVRGYRQDALLTDNGVFASAEVRLPILRIPKIDGVLQVTPFIEFGRGWNVDRPDPDPNNLLSTGLGLRWQMGDSLTARFDWGIPLISAKDSNKTLQEQGLYFTVLWNPF